MTKKIFITGGGTGGHVFPAIAIAEELKRRQFQVLYVGSAQGMEASLVPPRGIDFHAVKSGAVKNQSFLRIVKTAFQLLAGLFQSFQLMAREKPCAVIGVGGYVSVPVVLAAYLCRIPIYLQEQNTSVGIANRVLGKLATTIFLGFEEARSYFPGRKCVYTGNPLRADFYRLGDLATPAFQNHLLILGGSQGARAINDAVVNLLPKLESHFPGIQIIHQTGKRDFERIQSAYQAQSRFHRVVPFMDSMLESYQWADLVIARSGALTVSELLAVRKPAIFVPFPRRGQNDQTTNASLLANMKVAKVVEQGEGFESRLWEVLASTFQPQAIEIMNKSFQQLRTINALATIGDHITNDLTQ